MNLHHGSLMHPAHTQEKSYLCKIVGVWKLSSAILYDFEKSCNISVPQLSPILSKMEW